MPQTQEHREVQDVVRAHAGWVFACAKGRVRDEALAEDVAQAVFILFWQKRESLGGEAMVTGWLYRAVREEENGTWFKCRSRRVGTYSNPPLEGRPLKVGRSIPTRPTDLRPAGA